MDIGVDMVVALDDFDSPDDDYSGREMSTLRTIRWAKRCKDEFLAICKKRNLSESKRPYILGVVQGGKSRKLRKYCVEELVKIGFDGLGYGGQEKIGGVKVDYTLAKYIAKIMPENYLKYALGVGKPQDITALSKVGYNIFDCVLPTRDARHKRLYVYNASSINKIGINGKKFYSYYVPDKQKHMRDFTPVSAACDCLLCNNYTRAYLYHLFKIGDATAFRLSSIHNLRFYSLLMEKIRSGVSSK
jgi:queuine tRNA-ribosyltransferase